MEHADVAASQPADVVRAADDIRAPQVLTESASEVSAPTDQDSARESAMMNAAIRGQLAQLGSASKSDDGEDSPAGADRDPATAGGVNQPAGTQATTSRRGAAAEIERLASENARLAAELAQARPPAPDPSEQQRQAIMAREQRFRDLVHRTDDDPVLNQGDNWAFLQDEKRRRAAAPELAQHYETILEQDRAAVRAEYDRYVSHFRSATAADMATAADVPGVDFEAVKAARTFAERDRLMWAAGQASVGEEIKALRAENADLRRDLFGAVRTPLGNGRSSPGRTVSESDFFNALIRGNGR